MSEELIKSEQRKKEYGEIYTPDWMVEKMLDVFEGDEADLDKIIFEPSFGNGNFLLQILRRKLKKVNEEYSKDLTQWENHALLALTNIYGVEYLHDNAIEARERLISTFWSFYTDACIKLATKPSEVYPKNEIKATAHEILKENLKVGDTLKKKDHKGNYLVFTEWKLQGDLKKSKKIVKLKKRPFLLEADYSDVFCIVDLKKEVENE